MKTTEQLENENRALRMALNAVAGTIRQAGMKRAKNAHQQKLVSEIAEVAEAYVEMSLQLIDMPQSVSESLVKRS